MNKYSWNTIANNPNVRNCQIYNYTKLQKYIIKKEGQRSNKHAVKLWLLSKLDSFNLVFLVNYVQIRHYKYSL